MFGSRGKVAKKAQPLFVEKWYEPGNSEVDINNPYFTNP
jgi:hypothetical protein